jgi:hypothetical protein
MSARASATPRRIASRSAVSTFVAGAALATALLLVPRTSALAAGVFYVDNASSACSNSGAGTEAQPYCTIAAAVAARGGPGTTILVKPGVYREQVSVNASGQSGSPFVIRALGAVTIDAADDFSTTASWTLGSGSVYRAAGVTWNPVQVFVDDVRLTKSTSSPSTLAANSFVWVSGQGLYVNLGGANPGTRQTKVGRRTYGISMYARSYVTIDGFSIVRSEDRGLNLGDACTNVSILRNRISYHAKQGLYVNGGSGFLFGSNTVTDNADHGIYAVTGVTGSIFEDNECARNAHPTVRSANGIYLYGAPGNVIRRNRFHHNQDSGLQIQSGSNGNVCYLNRSWLNGDHGYDHLFATNTIHVSDVAYGNYKDGFSIEGNATGTQIYNSIAVDNGLTTGEFDLWVDSGSVQGFLSNYNIFWNSTSQAPFKYVSTTHTAIGTYRAASGQDAQSLQANPRFANANAGDFHLLAGSPAIDSGNSGVAYWQALDAVGVGRADDAATANTGAGPIAFGDRGSFEFVGVVQSNPPVVTAPVNVSGTENVALTVTVTAADPDGDPIASLTATGLPAGASFSAGPGNTTGQLTWTPSFAQAGSHQVTFIASNGLSGSATTTITIANVDRRPVVTAPAALSVRPTYPLIFQVTASDPDGDAITSLTVAPLPAGATFTPNANKTAGTFSWYPTALQVGSYNLGFTAGNALTSTPAVTAVTVSTTGDQNPVVTSPASLTVRANVNLTFGVAASDPDGNAIQSLTAAPLPAGATFTPSANNTAGTFSWTPTPAQQGNQSVTFTASNQLLGWSTTNIFVRPPNDPPTAVLSVTPSTGNAPLTVVASAAGSSDSDGGIASYNFNFGDGVSTGAQATNTASHVYAGGTWTCSVTVTDVDGGTTTVSQTVIVAPAATGTNFVTNSSFESSASGWTAFGTATLQRVAGGFDGGWSLQVSTTRNQRFGADDSPNAVANTGPTGTRYRCQAWVRSVAGTGEIRLRVQEFKGADRVGDQSSAGVVLSPTWQLVSLDYVAVGAGNTLDLHVIDHPHGSNLPFLMDNVSVRIVTGPAPALAQGGPTDGLEDEIAQAPAGPPLRAVLAPAPLVDRSTLLFRTTRPGPLSVTLYDLSGRKVRRLLEDPYAAAGPHRIPVDGYGDGGKRLGAGVYFYRVRGVEGEAFGRFVIAR